MTDLTFVATVYHCDVPVESGGRIELRIGVSNHERGPVISAHAFDLREPLIDGDYDGRVAWSWWDTSCSAGTIEERVAAARLACAKALPGILAKPPARAAAPDLMQPSGGLA